MLNYKVDVPYPKMKKHHRPASYDNDTLDEIVTYWMRENIEFAWNWQCENIWPDRFPYIVFRFEDEIDATTFKLRWL